MIDQRRPPARLTAAVSRLIRAEIERAIVPIRPDNRDHRQELADAVARAESDLYTAIEEVTS